jgi:hypothetical protein
MLVQSIAKLGYFIPLRFYCEAFGSSLQMRATSGSWTNATLIAAPKNHITNQVTHYKGKCYAWGVVNEASNDDGTYRTDVFYNTIGPEYIPIGFETAAAADPSVKLYYNDYNIESSGAKATAAQNLVKSLKARGIKIDSVGLQAHLYRPRNPVTSNPNCEPKLLYRPRRRSRLHGARHPPSLGTAVNERGRAAGVGPLQHRLRLRQREMRWRQVVAVVAVRGWRSMGPVWGY